MSWCWTLLLLLDVSAAKKRRTHGNDVAEFVRGLRREADEKEEQVVVLFRTHVLDPLTARLGAAVVAATDAVVVYDADVLGPNISWARRTVGVGLSDLLARYALKSQSPIAKSHYQHLAYAYAFSRLRDYAYAWCVEHDVGFTGSWGALLDAHASDPRDLLAWRVGWTPKIDRVHGGGSWNARMLYGVRADPADVGFLFGPIVRFSSRFLGFLDELGRAGVYGHAETFVPTICNQTAWCDMGNISDGYVGLLDYQLPAPITSDVFDVLEDLAPGKLFHPVRDTASASSASNVMKGLASKSRQRRHQNPTVARYVALCLLKNPRPVRPSFNAPVGLPHYLQRTCPVVNCLWGRPPDHRYVHLAVPKCIDMCKKNPNDCPFDTAVVVHPPTF